MTRGGDSKYMLFLRLPPLLFVFNNDWLTLLSLSVHNGHWWYDNNTLCVHSVMGWMTGEHECHFKLLLGFIKYDFQVSLSKFHSSPFQHWKDDWQSDILTTCLLFSHFFPLWSRRQFSMHLCCRDSGNMDSRKLSGSTILHNLLQQGREFLGKFFLSLLLVGL